MIRIAICEDEAFFRDRLLDSIAQYFELLGEQYAVDTYQKGEQLLETQHMAYSILCLDVEIKEGMNGIELAKRLREHGNISQIIFITNHQEAAYKAFEVDAFRYLLKPVQKETLYQTLDALLLKIKAMQKQKIVLKVGQNFIQLQIAEILYIETIGRKIKVCTLKKEYISDNKLGEIEEKLVENDFFRVHKSYLVNFFFIKEHTNNTVTMQDEKQVFISRLRLIPFKKRFLCYLRRGNSGDHF